MSRVYTFNKTVRGHLHVMNEFPCQDSSVSLSAENEKYFIAVIADGHGSKSCFRSDYGSKCATEVATECLKQFAEATLASEESEDKRAQTLSNVLFHRKQVLVFWCSKLQKFYRYAS